MSSKAVNRPVDLKQKEKDVNNKLQLFGIFQAFANGKVPSNKQIDIALNSALASHPLSSPSKKLSSEGQKLVSDLRNVIEQAKVLLLTKNEGNLLQDFIWQAEQITGANTSLPNAPVDKDTAKQHGNEALDGLRTLGTLLISNGQFRKLLSDATVLLRDIAGDAAQNTANKVKPSEDRLNRLDEPAEDNTWHDTPDLSRDKLRNQAKSSLPFGKKDAKEAVGDVNQAANPDGSRDPRDTAQHGAHEGQTGQSTGLDARAAANVAKQKVNENMSEEDKDAARARRDQLNNYLKGKMPEERRDQTIWRLKKMVVEIQGHQDYQRAIETLLRLAEEYAGHGKNVGQQTTGTVQGAHQDDALQIAEADLKTLLERFANNTSSDDLIESINQVYKDADQDPELKNWFKRLDAFIRKTLQQQGFILEDRCTDEWNRIYDDGHHLLRGRYRGHTDRIADEFKFIGEQFDADPQNKQFADSVNKLFLDLGNDENGKTVFKPHLVKDLTDVILPGIFENVRYIPIPRIEYSDPMVDAVVENLVIEGDNLAPNSLEFGSDNYWRWGRKSISSKNKNKVMLSVSGVQMDLRDVSYYIKRKQGFPSITDKGVMDIFMGGSGFSFKVEMETADKARENHAQTHFFKVTKVESDIKNLQIKMKKSNHKLLFNMFKPLLLKVMRPVIQKVLEKQIKDSANQLDGILYDVKTEADRAEAEAKRNPDPQNLQNMYQRYANAAQKRVMQGKQKKEELKEKTKDTQVNMAVTQHDSIFKNISLPGGISSKATEYKELAAKGDKWESPIFSIGSAKETSSLPKIGNVTRKPHGRPGGYDGPHDQGAGQGLGASSGLNPTSGYGTSNQTGQGLYSNQSTGAGLTGTQQHGQGLTGGLPGSQQHGQGLSGGQGLTGGLPGTHEHQQQQGGQGFGTQVDNAFNNAPGTTGGSTGLGNSAGTQGSNTYNTSFGDQNPVFQGRV
ncbi:Nn.00g102990.m01.CDS01 [Neocucurbitaria sp. VM-36]